MKKRIHVNQHNIRANAKGADLPVLTMKTSKGNIKCNRVEIHGPSTVVYSPGNPLAGLRAETYGDKTHER